MLRVGAQGDGPLTYYPGHHGTACRQEPTQRTILSHFSAPKSTQTYFI